MAFFTKSILPTFLIALISVRCFAAEGASNSEAADGIAVLVDVLKTNDDPSFQLDILKGINAAVEGRRRVKSPAGWNEVREKLLKSDNADVRKQTQALSSVFGDATAFVAMRKTLADRSAAPADRSAALTSLRSAHDPDLPATLESLLSDERLRTSVIEALSDYDDPKTVGLLLAGYAKFDDQARNAALGTLASRLESAKQLIAAVNANQVPQKDLGAATVRSLRDLGDKEVDAFVDAHWGMARTTPKDKSDEIARWKQILTDDEIAKADPAHGRALFTKTCAICHTLYGEGAKVGPDLTGSNRANLDYFLLNVIDPSAIIAREYQVTMIRTKDKRVVSGIATESEHSVKLISDKGTTVVPREEIDKLKTSELSMMPEGLLKGLPESDVADLVAYLRTRNEVPLPGAAK